MSCTFCPNCANLLLVEECSGGSGLRFCCATCPYIYEIDKEVRPFSRRAALVSPLLLQITHVVPTQCKEVDDVLGGDAAWANVDSTTGAPPPAHAAPPASAHLSLAARCPKCQHDRAFFMQEQIRSGDEPMTTFYKARAASACLPPPRPLTSLSVYQLQEPVARGIEEPTE